MILTTPDPPDDLPYEEYEDFRTSELLKANGVALTGGALIGALTGEPALAGAAAHALGALGTSAAVPALERIAGQNDDLLQAEAAYALVRLGAAERRDVLKACLQRALNAYLSPLVAAGYLAQLGDPVGFPVVTEGLGVDNLIVRVVACKQLHFFVRFHSTPAEPGAQPIDVYAQFERALHDAHPDVQWAALIQLNHQRGPGVRALLESYASSGPPPAHLAMAQRLLAANT